MSKLLVKLENLIEPKVEIIKKHLLAGDYIICCDIQDPNDIGTLIIENVICIKEEFKDINHQFIIEYTVTNDPNNQKFSLHDNIAVVLTNNELLDKIAANILRLYSCCLLDDSNVERNNIYGKLGTEHEDKVIFRY